jgi:hypothetical protein
MIDGLSITGSSYMSSIKHGGYLIGAAEIIFIVGNDQ